MILPGEGGRIVVHPPALLTPAQGAEEDGSHPQDDPLPLPTAEALEARKLSTLVDVSQALAGHLNLQAGFGAMLLILQRRCSVIRGAVALLDDRSGTLQLRASIGLDRGERPSHLESGALHQVLTTGEPVLIPNLHGDSQLVPKRPDRRERQAPELSFLGVPVLLHRRSIGTLAVELQYRPERDLERLLKFLRVVASMVSQAVRIHRLLDAERHKLVSENAQLRQELQQQFHFSNLIGMSGPMRQLYEEVARVASTNTTVLIRGESGTGKELIAQAIHLHSPRAARAFVKVNCAALPETLVESELFGHERGAFTGAQQRKQGRFELANGGTIFLDEIGELSPGTQVKLLRVLQEREFERVGGTDSVRVDVRVIAATNRNLEKALAESHFREDLYYRLNVFPIFIPPLRARKADVLPLADHFVEKYAREHGKQIRRLSTSAIDLLSSYHWPGNVRELENTIERAVLLADGGIIHGYHLPPTLQTADATGTLVSSSLGSAVEAFERSLIEDALKSTRGNRSRAARLLNTTDRVISYKIKKYGINPADLRD
ncbi:MAG TPA: sigma 54-interacting transcriptional regulator [Gemmatimonadales bacterium]|nr:sigma 54-interacting transcriptional regulator [Gemmatimonadales bacterium]